MIQLGQKCEDVITGFTGIAVGRVVYISGCNQVLLAPRVTGEGTKREAEWFDEQRMRVLESEALVLDNSKTPGFDKAAPKR